MYRSLGLRTVSPTRIVAHSLKEGLLAEETTPTRRKRGPDWKAKETRGMTRASVYIIIVGGGKIGYFLARQLLEDQHEVLIIEQNAEKGGADRRGPGRDRDGRRRL